MGVEDERERHWRMLIGENESGIDEQKGLLYDKRWDVYMRENITLIKDGYSVKILGYYGKKVIWKVINDHVVKYPKENDDIRLRGFNFIFLGEDEWGV